MYSSIVLSLCILAPAFAEALVAPSPTKTAAIARSRDVNQPYTSVVTNHCQQHEYQFICNGNLPFYSGYSNLGQPATAEASVNYPYAFLTHFVPQETPVAAHQRALPSVSKLDDYCNIDENGQSICLTRIANTGATTATIDMARWTDAGEYTSWIATQPLYTKDFASATDRMVAVAT